MSITRFNPRKVPEKVWHFDDPTFYGPFCKCPKYGDFYPDSHWPVTQNQKAVTCKKCIERMKQEGLWKDENN